MKTTVETTDPTHVTIRVELPWEMIADELDSAYKELAKDINIPGFRKGKVPRNVLRQRFGKRVEEDVAARIIQDSYEAALIQNKVRAVSRPELERGQLVDGKPYAYTAVVEVQPEIEIKNTRVAVDAAEPEVKDEMIQEELTRLQESNAVLTPIEGRTVAEAGDTAIVDYQASQGGKPVEGGAVQNHEIQLGSGKAVPGFEDQLLGMQVGEDRAFDLTFPADWGAGKMAGQTVHFDVKLGAIKMRELPRLDDDFAKDLGRENCETLEDLRELIHAEVLERETSRVERETKDKLVDALIEANPFPVPPALIDRQQQSLAQEVELFLAQQGMSPEQAGLSRKKMKDDMRERAEREVKAGMLLEAVAEREKIEVSEGEIEEHLAKVAERSGQNMAKIKALYAEQERRSELAYKIRQEKALDYLLRVSSMKDNEEAAASDEPPAADLDTSDKRPNGEDK